jgi:conjugal transfer mating pair stabilization protein TraG
MGSMASNSLVNMRAVLEALIYGSFVIIIPLALIPGGIKFIFSWIWLCIWIQLWPPFYAILNYIMQLAAKSYATTIMFGLSGDEIGLSLFTSEGLQNLHENISALTGYLALSIPFISYTILQGAQSFVHLVGTLAGPAQAAASSASVEQTSGNYSYANTNVGQMSYLNTSALQSNTAPSISSGFTSEHHGSYTAIHASDGTSVVKQHNSDLKSSLFSDEAISQSLQNNYQTAETHTASKQQSYSESISKSGRALEDFTNHFGSSTSYSQSLSERDGNSIQESCGYMKNLVESFSNQHGVSTSESYEILGTAGASASLGFRLIGSGVSSNFSTSNNFSNSVSSSDALNAAKNIASSEDFQKHFNNVVEYSRNNAHSTLNDEGVKFASGLTESLDNVKSSQDSYQNALNEMNQASQNLNWSQSNSQQIKRSLNQDFVNWSKEKIGYTKTIEMLESRSNTEREQMMGEFLNEYITELSSNYALDNYREPQESYKTQKIQSLNYENELGRISEHSAAKAEKHGLNPGLNHSHKESLEIRSDILGSQANQNFKSKRNHHSTTHTSMRADFEAKKADSRLERMYSELLTDDTMNSKYDPKAHLLWLQEEN